MNERLVVWISDFRLIVELRLKMFDAFDDTFFFSF